MTDTPTTIGQPWDDEDEEWDDQAADECEHEHATMDVLTGELLCSCGHYRYLSADEIKREAEFQAQMIEVQHEEEAERDVSSG